MCDLGFWFYMVGLVASGILPTGYTARAEVSFTEPMAVTFTACNPAVNSMPSALIYRLN